MQERKPIVTPRGLARAGIVTAAGLSAFAVAHASLIPLPKAPVEQARLTKATPAPVALPAEEEVLSQEEADAILNFLAERFVHRRFTDLLDQIATPQARGWFVLAHHHLGQQQ